MVLEKLCLKNSHQQLASHVLPSTLHSTLAHVFLLSRILAKFNTFVSSLVPEKPPADCDIIQIVCVVYAERRSRRQIALFLLFHVLFSSINDLIIIMFDNKSCARVCVSYVCGCVAAAESFVSNRNELGGRTSGRKKKFNHEIGCKWASIHFNVCSSEFHHEWRNDKNAPEMWKYLFSIFISVPSAHINLS